MCPWEDVSSGSFYITIYLEPEPPHLFILSITCMGLHRRTKVNTAWAVSFGSVYTILIGERKGGCRQLSGEWIILGKMNGPLEWMGSMIICDKVCLRVVWASSVFSTKDCRSSLVYDLTLLLNSKWGSTAHCPIGKLWRQRFGEKKWGSFIQKLHNFGRMTCFCLRTHFL